MKERTCRLSKKGRTGRRRKGGGSPFAVIPASALDEVDLVRSGDGKGELVARQFLRTGHLHRLGHVDHRLGDRVGLPKERRTTSTQDHGRPQRHCSPLALTSFHHISPFEISDFSRSSSSISIKSPNRRKTRKCRGWGCDGCGICSHLRGDTT